MLALLLAVASVAPSPPPSADLIFSYARAFLLQQHYPRALDYVVHVRAVIGTSIRENHYDSRMFAASGFIGVDPRSAEEKAHPYVPPGGFTFRVFGQGNTFNASVDAFGVPLLLPSYTFGLVQRQPEAPLQGMALVQEIRREFHDPLPPSRAQALGVNDSLSVIASVRAQSRNYVPTLVGADTVGGHADYHLSLRPLRDPKKYRLRDLWIDEKTYAIDQLISDGNFVDGPGPAVPWTVTFQTVDGALYIDTESADAPIQYGRVHYAAVSVSFENIRPGPNTVWGVSSGVAAPLVLTEP